MFVVCVLVAELFLDFSRSLKLPADMGRLVADAARQLFDLMVREISHLHVLSCCTGDCLFVYL